MQLQPGTRLAGYEITGAIGAGGDCAGWNLEPGTDDQRTSGWMVDRWTHGQRFNPSGRLEGKPIPVRHFHGTDWANLSTSFGKLFRLTGSSTGH